MKEGGYLREGLRDLEQACNVGEAMLGGGRGARCLVDAVVERRHCHARRGHPLHLTLRHATHTRGERSLGLNLPVMMGWSVWGARKGAGYLQVRQVRVAVGEQLHALWVGCPCLALRRDEEAEVRGQEEPLRAYTAHAYWCVYWDERQSASTFVLAPSVPSAQRWVQTPLVATVERAGKGARWVRTS